MAKEVKIKISAKDKASKNLGKVKSAVIGLIGAWVGMQSLRKLGQFVGESIQAFAQQETAVKKVQAVLKSTGNQIGLSVKDFKDFADQMQRTTAIADDQVLSAQALGLTFTAISKEVFPGFMTAAADMSQAMGTEMKDSVIQLGKALQDPDLGIAALRRVGINTDEISAKFTDAMPIMEKQRLILEELSIEFGGMAEAMGATFQGRITRIGHQFGDLKEVIGGVIGKSEAWNAAIGAISEQIGELTDWLNSNEDEIKEWGNNFAFTVVNTTRTVIDILADLATAYSAVMIPILGVVKATSYLSGKPGTDIRKALDGMIENLDTFGVGAQITKLKLDAIAETIEIAMLEAVNKAKEEIKEFGNAGEETDKKLEGVGNSLKQIIQISPDLTKASHEVRDGILSLVPGMEEVELAVNHSSTEMLIAFEQLRYSAFSISKQFVSGLVDTMYSARQSFAEYAKEFLIGISKMIAKMILFKTLSAVFGMPMGGGFGGFLFGQHGLIIPGGAPHTDRVPIMATPGERLLSRGEYASLGGERGLQQSFQNSASFEINVSGLGSNEVIGQVIANAIRRELPSMFEDMSRRRQD